MCNGEEEEEKNLRGNRGLKYPSCGMGRPCYEVLHDGDYAATVVQQEMATRARDW